MRNLGGLNMEFQKASRGVTLIETMIAVLVSFIAMAAVGAVVTAGVPVQAASRITTTRAAHPFMAELRVTTVDSFRSSDNARA